MHFDLLISKLWFAVHRILQGCATDSVGFSSTGCSSCGLAPLAPDKLSPFTPPFLFLSLVNNQIDEVFLRCGLLAYLCNMHYMGLHLSCFICMIRLKIEVSNEC